MFKSSTAVSKGISAGLRLGLFFLFSFLLLKYPPLLSLFLSTLGGSSVGLIVSWWHTQDEPQPLEVQLPDEIADLKEGETPQAIVSKMRLESQRKSRRRRYRKQRSTSLLGWLLGRF